MTETFGKKVDATEIWSGYPPSYVYLVFFSCSSVLKMNCTKYRHMSTLSHSHSLSRKPAQARPRARTQSRGNDGIIWYQRPLRKFLFYHNRNKDSDVTLVKQIAMCNSWYALVGNDPPQSPDPFCNIHNFISVSNVENSILIQEFKNLRPC